MQEFSCGDHQETKHNKLELCLLSAPLPWEWEVLVSSLWTWIMGTLRTDLEIRS